MTTELELVLTETIDGRPACETTISECSSEAVCLAVTSMPCPCHPEGWALCIPHKDRVRQIMLEGTPVACPYCPRLIGYVIGIVPI